MVVTWQCRGSTQAYWDIPWHSCLEDHALTLYCHAEFSLFSCGSSHLWPWQYPLFVVAVQVFWSIWCVAGATWGIIFKPYPVTISQQRIMLEQTAKSRSDHFEFFLYFHVQICNMADRLPRDGLLLNRVCGKKITASCMNPVAPRSNMPVGITFVRCALGSRQVHFFVIFALSRHNFMFGFDQKPTALPGALFVGWSPKIRGSGIYF